jgi:hypothetical protein
MMIQPGPAFPQNLVFRKWRETNPSRSIMAILSSVFLMYAFVSPSISSKKCFKNVYFGSLRVYPYSYLKCTERWLRHNIKLRHDYVYGKDLNYRYQVFKLYVFKSACHMLLMNSFLYEACDCDFEFAPVCQLADQKYKLRWPVWKIVWFSFQQGIFWKVSRYLATDIEFCFYAINIES